jgi:hypothetical protein
VPGPVGTLERAWGTLAIVASLSAGAVLTLLVAVLLAPVRAERRARATRLGALAVVAFVALGLAAARVPDLGRHVAVPAARLAVEQSRAFVSSARTSTTRARP